MKVKRKYLILALIVIASAWMLIDSVTQPGPDKLKGGFEERGFIRNEQNTGPVVRLYSVTLQDTLWDEMEKYGNFMPHSKYGTTRVYFFLAGQPFPTQLNLEDPNVAEAYRQSCVGKYEKNTMGQVSLVKFPFR